MKKYTYITMSLLLHQIICSDRNQEKILNEHKFNLSLIKKRAAYLKQQTHDPRKTDSTKKEMHKELQEAMLYLKQLQSQIAILERK